MKNYIFLILLLYPVFVISQVSEIEKILNRELKKEVLAQEKDRSHYYGDTFKVVEKFNIKDSVQTMTAINAQGKEEALMQTTMKILTVEVRKKNYYGEDFYTEKQEVDLRKITAIVKDINIIFETSPDAVKTTQTDEKGNKTVKSSDLFFLNLSYEKANEYLAEEIVKAFKKADCPIVKRYWYD